MTKILRLLALFCILVFTSNTAYSAGYTCDSIKKYTSCNSGYYMTYNGSYNGTAKAGNTCTKCPTGCTCAGGTANKVCPVTITLNKNGGTGTLSGGSGYSSLTSNGSTKSETFKCTPGATVTLPTSGPSHTKYTRRGWSTSTTGTTITSYTCPSANATLYMTWTGTITWNKNDISATTSGATTNNSGTTSSTTT